MLSHKIIGDKDFSMGFGHFSLGVQSPYKADRTSTLKWEAEASSSTYKLQVHSKREDPI